MRRRHSCSPLPGARRSFVGAAAYTAKLTGQMRAPPELDQILPLILTTGKICQGALRWKHIHWFLLGMMAAWTPGMQALVVILGRHDIHNSADNSR